MRVALTFLLVAGAIEARAQCSPLHPTLCDLPVRSLIEQPALDRAVDIVLVGDGFTDLDGWRGTADAHIAAFREAQTDTRVYAAVPGVYNFHVVDVVSPTDEVGDADLADTALGTRAVGREPITADMFRVALAALSAPDVDVLYVVANSVGGRANASFPSTLASGGAVRMPLDPRAASHELGHAVVRLADEYIEAALCPGGDELTVFTVRNVTADPDCYRFAEVEGAECRRGNLYCADDFYRSARGCLMRTSGNTRPCPVCADTIERTLLQRRTWTDHADPWPVIERPAEGAPVRGRTLVRTWVWDDYIIDSVVFLELDGAVVDQTQVDPWAATTSIDTRALSNGEHTLVAVAVDPAGHTRRSLPRRFVVANGSPEDPPVVELLEPAAGSDQARGPIRFLARATDALGQPAPRVEQMSVMLDGELLEAVVGNELEVWWDASRAPLGIHTYEITARGEGQSGATTGPLELNILPVDRAPDLEVTAPAPWAGVHEYFVLSYRLSGVLPGGRAELLVDGVRARPLPVPAPGEEAVVVVDARAWALGAHELLGRLIVGPFEFESPVLPVVRVDAEAASVRLVGLPEAVAGEWPVEAIAVAPTAIERVTLHVAGVGEVARALGSHVTLEWRTLNQEDGCYVVWAEVRAEGGEHAVSEAAQVCVHNQPPAPVIVSPADGAAVAAGALAVRVRLEGELPLRVDHTIDVREAGVLLGRTTGVREEATVTVALPAGDHEIAAEATNAFGVTTVSPPIRLRVDACAAPEDCDDEDPCTEDVCAPSGLCVNRPEAGCCRVDADCADGDPCAAFACEEARCVRGRVDGCCNHAADCPDDGDPCTVEVCPEPGGACDVEPGPCCEGDDDCDDDDRCTIDTCLPDLLVCAQDPDPDCCEVDGDCDDGDPCTEELCRAGGCLRDGPREDCCRFDFECDDADGCTTDACVDNGCRNTPVAGCCAEPGACPTLNPCAEGRCVVEEGRCEEVPVAGCCVFDRECADEDVCTVDLCVDNVCVHQDECCFEAAECDDGEVCTADLCTDGFCTQEAVAGCCHGDAECDDGDACTAERCEENACVAEPVDGCCNEDAECDRGDPCVVARCELNACIFVAIAGCCNVDAECAGDGDPCTFERCAEHACVVEAVPDCPPPDARVPDAAVPDAAPDMAPDMAPDLGPDAQVDAAPDAAPDVPPPPAPDTGPDAPPSPPDAAPDLAVDLDVADASPPVDSADAMRDAIRRPDAAGDDGDGDGDGDNDGCVAAPGRPGPPGWWWLLALCGLGKRARGHSR